MSLIIFNTVNNNKEISLTKNNLSFSDADQLYHLFLKMGIIDPEGHVNPLFDKLECSIDDPELYEKVRIEHINDGSCSLDTVHRVISRIASKLFKIDEQVINKYFSAKPKKIHIRKSTMVKSIYDNPFLSTQSCQEIRIDLNKKHISLNTGWFSLSQCVFDVLAQNVTFSDTIWNLDTFLEALCEMAEGKRVLKTGEMNWLMSALIGRAKALDADFFSSCLKRCLKNNATHDPQRVFILLLTFCQLLQTHSIGSNEEISSFIKKVDNEGLITLDQTKNDLLTWMKKALVDNKMPFSHFKAHLLGLLLFYPQFLVNHDGDYAFRLPIPYKDRTLYLLLTFNSLGPFYLMRVEFGSSFVELYTLFLKMHPLNPGAILPKGYGSEAIRLGEAWLKNKNSFIKRLGGLCILCCQESRFHKGKALFIIGQLHKILDLTHDYKVLKRIETEQLVFFLTRLEAKLPQDGSLQAILALKNIVKENQIPPLLFWISQLLSTGDPHYVLLGYKLYQQETKYFSQADHNKIFKLLAEKDFYSQALALFQETVFFTPSNFKLLVAAWSKKDPSPKLIDALLMLAELVKKLIKTRPLPKDNKQNNKTSSLYITLIELIIALNLHDETWEGMQLLKLWQQDLTNKLEYSKNWIESLTKALQQKGNHENLGHMLKTLFQGQILDSKTTEVVTLIESILVNPISNQSELTPVLLHELIDNSPEQLLKSKTLEDVFDRWLADQFTSYPTSDKAFELLFKQLSNPNNQIRKKNGDRMIAFLKKEISQKNCLDREKMLLLNKHFLKLLEKKLDNTTKADLCRILIDYLPNTMTLSWKTEELSALINFCLSLAPKECVQEITSLINKINPPIRDVSINAIEFLNKWDEEGKPKRMVNFLMTASNKDCERFRYDFFPSLLKHLDSNVPNSFYLAFEIIKSHFEYFTMNDQEHEILMMNNFGLTFKEQIPLLGQFLLTYLKKACQSEKEVTVGYELFIAIAPSLFYHPKILHPCLDEVVNHLFKQWTEQKIKEWKFNDPIPTAFYSLLFVTYVHDTTTNNAQVDQYFAIFNKEFNDKEIALEGYYPLVMKKCLESLIKINANPSLISTFMGSIIVELLINNTRYCTSKEELGEMLTIMTFSCPPDTPFQVELEDTIEKTDHFHHGKKLLNQIVGDSIDSSNKLGMLMLYYYEEKKFSKITDPSTKKKMRPLAQDLIEILKGLPNHYPLYEQKIKDLEKIAYPDKE